MFEVFGDFEPTEHAAEAEQRWGDTDAYRESTRRTSSYTREDWQRISAAGEAVMYVADPRFTAHYDDRAPGLAAYVHDAIHASADRADLD